MYYTYVLRSQVDKNLYIGWTADLDLRIKDHNEGRVKSTISRKPFEIVYFEACNSRVKAIRREKQLKSGFGRKYLKKRI